MTDRDYVRGNRAAWLSMLQECLRNLEIDDPERQKVKWVSEREQTISMLRLMCGMYGDNDWPDDLYIPDIIEKHLCRYMND